MIRWMVIGLGMLLLAACDNPPAQRSIDDQVEYILNELHDVDRYQVFASKSTVTDDLKVQIEVRHQGQVIKFEYLNDNYHTYTMQSFADDSTGKSSTFTINNDVLSIYTWVSLINHLETLTGHKLGVDTRSLNIFPSENQSIAFSFTATPDCYGLDQAGTVTTFIDCEIE